MSSPNLQSEMQPKDMASQQFVDMFDAIAYLTIQLHNIATNKVADPRKCAKLALDGVQHIYKPVLRIG